MIRVALVGASGRMGKWVQELISIDYADRMTVSCRLDRSNLQDDLQQALSADLIIDFSLPEATEKVVWAMQGGRHRPVYVIGSTGHTESQRAAIQDLSRETKVLCAANFSLGILLMSEALRGLEERFSLFGFSINLSETHHRHKKDAPSGTAKELQKILNPRHPESVPTVSLRGGDVVGIHEVHAFGNGENLVFKHEALDRSVFARGAIEAGLWLYSHPASAGSFSFRDILNPQNGKAKP